MARESSLSKLPMAAKVGVGAALALVIGVAYYFLFYVEISSQIKNAQAQESSLQAQQEAARQEEAAYQKDLAELNDRQDRIKELAKVLPEEPNYPAFLSAVQATANTAGINLVAWEPQPEVQDQFFSRVPMRLSLVGRFHQVARFFHGIGQQERIINAENISMTEPKPVGDEVHVKVDLLATAFRALPPAETPAPARAP